MAYRTGSPPTVAGAAPDLSRLSPDSLLPEASLDTLIWTQDQHDGGESQFTPIVEIFIMIMKRRRRTDTAAKIAATVRARRDLVVIACTDATGSEGTVARDKLYIEGL